MKRAPIKAMPSTQELGRLFLYDPETGSLTWKWVRPRAYRIAVGQEVGTISEKGYKVVGIGRRYYLVHRIIWKMMTGEEPADQIDHIDGNRLNNKWSNLRAADNGRNRWNSKLPKNSTSGFKGVYFRAANGRRKWIARLYIEKKKAVHLGCFETREEAASVWWNAAQQRRHEFARLA